jgi:hypothetical protein
MLLPFRRDALREKNRLDEADEDEVCARMTPSERLERSLELSNMARELAESVGASWTQEASASLEEKARLYVAPMRALLR